MSFERILDERTRLELVSVAHADALYRLIDSNREHLRPWVTFVDKTRSVDDINQFVLQAIAGHDERNEVVAAILLDGEPRGCVGLTKVDVENGSAEIGYWLGKESEGLGLVTRSARVLLEVAFEELHLNRVQLCALSGNARSRAVAHRLGFTHEGTLRQFARREDGPKDLECYSMLREEWESRKAPAEW